MLNSSAMPPKKKSKKDTEKVQPTRVTITLPSDEENWEKNLPDQHGK